MTYNVLDQIDLLTAQVVAEYQAGGYEPDGVGLALGGQVANDVTLLGWGRDLSCGFTGHGGEIDCDDHFSEVDPNSPIAVEQALVRRLSTPHGQIINDEELLIAVGEDPDYGFNLIQLLSVGIDPTKIQAYKDLAVAECRKDDRVKTVTIDLTVIDPQTVNLLVYGELRTGQSYSLVMPLISSTLAQALS